MEYPMRITPIGVALACLASPFAPLAAQGQHGGSRAGLGILLEGHADGADSAGVKVRGVMPQGPADKAGLARGDVIVRFNGTPVGGAEKLVELAHALQPGDTVKLEYRRGSESRTATVIADRIRPRFAMMFPKGADGGFGLQGGHNMLFLHSRHGVGLALVPMSRDLGEYFGTADGFLVVKAPADSASPLKAGDVILAIDGRKPQSVEHAHRILGSYAPGEKAKLDVMRKKQRTTLTWTAPARREHDGHFGMQRRYGLEQGDALDDSDAMDFEIPMPDPPDMDFMMSLPSSVESQET
jgi:predicted metalloprotease with PDZ domain